MDVLKQRRKKLVRKLRECAKLAEVQLERDDASRSKVRALFDRVAAKGCAVTTAKAAEAFKEYETTWGNTNADKAEESAELKVLRLRGKSFLFSCTTPLQKIREKTSCHCFLRLSFFQIPKALWLCVGGDNSKNPLRRYKRFVKKLHVIASCVCPSSMSH